MPRRTDQLVGTYITSEGHAAHTFVTFEALAVVCRPTVGALLLVGGNLLVGLPYNGVAGHWSAHLRCGAHLEGREFSPMTIQYKELSTPAVRR